MKFHAFVTIGALLVICTSCGIAGESLYKSQSKLLSNFTGDYDTKVAPQENATVPIAVSLQLSLAYILELNEKKGKMVTSLYPTVSWYDERLSWDQTIYPFDTLSLTADQLWLPAIEVIDRMESMESSVTARIFVYSNGTVVYTSQMVAETPCPMNLVHFPFDVHYCHVDFMSWSGTNDVIDIQWTTPSYSPIFYDDHLNWKLLGVNTTQLDRYDIATGLVYKYARISVHVSRSSSYFYRLFVAPAAICLFVIPVVHFLPPSSNEKLTLGGLMLVAATIMFEMAEDFFPASSLQNVPLILHYYTFLLISIFVSLLLSCLSVMIGTGESKSARVPRFLRICCIDRLGYICCAKGRTSRYDYELLHLEKSLRFSALRQNSGENEDEQELEEVTDEEGTAANNHTSAPAAKNEGMTEVLKTLINELQYARYKEQVKAEWLQLAMVIDRTGALILLTIAVIVTAVITLHSSPSA